MPRKKKLFNWCDFGEHWIEMDVDGKYLKSKHVYPIPDCDAYPDGPDFDGDGATACLKHWPEIYKLQLKQKLVTPVQ